MSPDDFRVLQLRSFLVHQVVHFATFSAEKMNMFLGVAIVANSVFVDGQHLCGSLFAHHPQRVVDGGLAEGRYLVAQSIVYIVDGRVDRVRHEVVHDGQSLYGWANVAFDQSVVCLFTIIHIIHFLITGAKIGNLFETSKYFLEKLQK